MNIGKAFAVLVYLFWVVVLALYGVTIWGLSTMQDTYIVELSRNSNTNVKVAIGFVGLCITPPSDSSFGTGETASLKCQAMHNFDREDDGPALVKKLFDEMDLEGTTGTGAYQDSLAILLTVARTIRNEVLMGTELIAAFVLLVLGGLLLVFPLFFNFQKRRSICMFLMAVASLCLGISFMLCGSAGFTIRRTLTLFEQSQAGGDVLFGNDISLEHGKVMSDLLKAALGVYGAYLGLFALTAYIRNHNGNKSKVKKDRVSNGAGLQTRGKQMKGRMKMPFSKGRY